MQNFYRLLEEEPDITKAEALRRAQDQFITGQSGAGEETKGAKRDLALEVDHGKIAPEEKFEPDAGAPYAHPFYWAPFILMGNWL
jgi:CHAT domain-containing protein